MQIPCRAELIHRIPVENILGEGIQWNAERGEIWWTDILDQKIYIYHWENKTLGFIEMPEAVCSFAFIQKNHSQLLIAFATGIAIYTLANGHINWIHPNLCDGVKLRLNDGRVDRQGRFWVGSMVMSDDPQLENTGKLYCLSSDWGLSVQETGIQISNGLCWSIDGTKMFFADSPKNQIYQYTFNPVEKNTQKNTWIQTAKYASPDGANIDDQDTLWSALWGAGKIHRYNSEGQIIQEVIVPASQPTCIAFGGPELNLLLVSSATEGLSENELLNQPRAGDVFIYKTNTKGIQEPQFILE